MGRVWRSVGGALGPERMLDTGQGLQPQAQAQQIIDNQILQLFTVKFLGQILRLTKHKEIIFMQLNNWPMIKGSKAILTICENLVCQKLESLFPYRRQIKENIYGSVKKLFLK